MTERYVSKTGNNANSGLGPEDANAWLTLAFAVPQLVAGDTLHVRAGTYNETLIHTIPSGTSASARVTIKRYQSEVVWLLPSGTPDTVIEFAANSQWIVIDGIGIDGNNKTGAAFGITTSTNCTRIDIKNLEIKFTRRSGINTEPTTTFFTFDNLTVRNCGTDTGDHGIYFNGQDSIIRYGRYHDNTGYGIHHSWEAGGVNRNRVHGNRCYANGTGGIIMNRGQDGFCYNNISYENGTMGIVIGQPNTVIYNNTVTKNNSHGIFISFATNGAVRNNISYLNTGNQLEFDNTTQDISTIGVSNNRTSDPLFVDEANDNFHLRSTSPARDAGFNLAGVVDEDFDRNPRPQNGSWDEGAYEFVTEPAPSPTTYYVSPSGNDGNTGTTPDPAGAFLTIAKGLSVLAAGDTLELRAGTYAESMSGSAFPGGTSWNNAVTIKQYQAEVVTLTGTSATIVNFPDGSNRQYVAFQGLVFDATAYSAFAHVVAIGSGCSRIRIEASCTIKGGKGNAGALYAGVFVHRSATHVEVRNSTITNNADLGVWFAGADNTLEQCVVNGSTYGVQMWDYDGNNANNNKILRNKIHNCGLMNPQDWKGGVWVGKGTQNLIANNLIHDNHVGLFTGDGANTTRILNNTVYGNDKYGVWQQLVAGGETPPASTLIGNNIIYNNAQGDFVDAYTANTTLQTNLINQNPFMIDPENGNFMLASGSPAREAGTDYSLYYTTDYVGETRPFGAAWDIGAYEATDVTAPAGKRGMLLLLVGR